ncbi:MAG: M20/M25/M40 family metallo-hydrolase [Gemmatimonadaceae bacterium]|nr:M20/M25/M40 family metallo-hydrolase [Gemmatimonadaceae bacterium]
MTSPIKNPRAVAHRTLATAALLVPVFLSAQPARSGTAPATAPTRPAARVATPGPDVFLVPLTTSAGSLRAGVPANLTRRDGYDNQAAFSENATELFYTSNRGDGQTDIYRYAFSTGLATPVQKTQPESEYSAFPIFSTARAAAANAPRGAAPSDAGRALAVIRVEADSTQRLWRLPLDGAAPSVMFPDIKPVGYFAQADDSTWAMFVLGSPATLHVGIDGRAGSKVLARNIGRSLHRIPGTSHVSFVQKGAADWYVMELDPHSGRIDTLVKTLPRAEDVAWVDANTLLMGQGTTLQVWRRGSAQWEPLADFAFAQLTGISRLAVSANRQWLAMVADVVPRVIPPSRAVYTDRFTAAAVKRGIETLAADSMEGRRTGTAGGARAAVWIAAQFKAAGLTPAGDSGGFQQYIPLENRAGPSAVGGGVAAPAQPRFSVVSSWAAWDTLPPAARGRASNVVGVLRGSDPTLRDETVLVTAHYDHLGYGRAVDGDSIFNGADDDASGVIAVIEMAKALQRGPRPKRTIVFMAITGEEVGGLGTRWYIANPARPLNTTVVDLNVEMIGHADSLAGGFGKAWLTGYERSTMGDLLANNGIPLVPDPRPTQRFFERSDNAAFARIGIPAHSLSSYNLISPYHHPKDDAASIDVAHMTQVIGATARALRLLADGPAPTWHPGGKPEAPQARPAR